MTTRRLLALPLAAALVACTAYRLPDPPSEPEPARVPPLGAAVILRSTLPTYLSPGQADAFLERLRDDLASTRVFASVEIGDEIAPGDVAVDNRSRPLALWGWVAGPLGLLPGWSFRLPTEQERESLRFSIRSAIAERAT
jgi:hypothetical protein